MKEGKKRLLIALSDPGENENYLNSEFILEFSKGDLLLLLNDENKDWYYVKHLESNNKGYVKSQSVITFQRWVSNEGENSKKIKKIKVKKIKQNKQKFKCTHQIDRIE